MTYAKAIAALVTPIILQMLLPLGVTGDMPVEQAIFVIISALLTGAIVYIVPNRN